MRRDEEIGLVVHNKDKCIGCWTCVLVCPYAALRMDNSGKVVAKCDMCSRLEKPACVAGCPNDALIYKEVSS
jgi:carbon-monoxide dehydrogenase iron sulfur subunit